MAYVGGGGNHNPMQFTTCWCGGGIAGDGTCGGCGAYHEYPRVIVFDVGQGNCNAIVGSTGKVIAYFDFGYSTTGTRQPAPPTRPCFCDRPPIILSHWDRDHINLGFHVPESLTADWLVPHQNHSSFANKLRKNIKRAGGRLLVWPQTKDPLRHVTFPWGFVEHGTEDPAVGPNGSGLAAYVCVQDSAGGAGVARAAARDTIDPSLDVQPVARARAAVGLVVGAVRSIEHDKRQRRAVRHLAKPLAAVLAASQPSGDHVHMPPQQCAEAAVRAARHALAGTAPLVAAAWLDTIALPSLRAANAAKASHVLLELAQAATNAVGAYGLRERAAEAAAALTANGSIAPAQWPWVGYGACLPRPAAPTLRAGRAPFHGDERFVLLNGDADYRWLPSVRARRAPKIAAMTAMHHGAVFEDGVPLAAGDIPFAPGSWEAKAVLRFRKPLAAGSQITMVVEGGRALSKRDTWGRKRGMRTAASRVALAAAAALHAIESAHPGDLLAAPTKFAYAAAAAAVAAWRTRDPSAIALAAVLGTTIEKVAADTGCFPLSGIVDLAVEAVAADRGGGAALTVARAQELSRGAIDGWLVTQHVLGMSADTTGSVGPAHSSANCGQEAASLLTYLWNNYPAGLSPTKRKHFRQRISLQLHSAPGDNLYPDVLNDLADAVSAAMYASRALVPNRLNPRLAAAAAGASVGVAGSGLRRLRQAISRSMRRSFGAGVFGVDAIVQQAIHLAAVRAVAYMIGRPPQTLSTVIDAARTHRGRAAALTARTGARKEQGRIAYSYGVDGTDSSHEYTSLVAGQMGHPHPLAIAQYEARGWTLRRNASDRARHGGLQGDPSRCHPHGHVGLGWDSQRGGAHSAGRAKFKCGSCGKTFVLNL
ncbi:MAG: hypothetical protein KC619_24200 [Myxococcales bacterium]|nr:hypothetical protein [Myxococcales bacterium]